MRGPDDVDRVLRHVSRELPHAVARALMGGGEAVGAAEWVDTQVTARQRPFWLIFAPLARDVDGDKLAQALEILRTQSSPREFEELCAAMAVLAATNRRVKGLEDVVTSSVSERLVMQNWIYREGRKEGRKEGRRQGQLQAFAHQFERRLGRPLTTTERQTLASRLAKLGPTRVGDVVLDRSPEALARWLTPRDEA